MLYIFSTTVLFDVFYTYGDRLGWIKPGGFRHRENGRVTRLCIKLGKLGHGITGSVDKTNSRFEMK